MKPLKILESICTNTAACHSAKSIGNILKKYTINDKVARVFVLATTVFLI